MIRNGYIKIDLSVCFECGDTASEMHHVIPRIKGGKKMVPLCGYCHGRVHGVRRVDKLSDLIIVGIKKAKIIAKEKGLPTPFTGRKKGSKESEEKTLSKYRKLIDMYFDDKDYSIRVMSKMSNYSTTTIQKVRKGIKEINTSKEEWYVKLPLSCQESYDTNGKLNDEDIDLIEYIGEYWLMIPYYKFQEENENK